MGKFYQFSFGFMMDNFFLSLPIISQNFNPVLKEKKWLLAVL